MGVFKGPNVPDTISDKEMADLQRRARQYNKDLDAIGSKPAIARRRKAAAKQRLRAGLS
jgi:hypothetical protein